MRIRVKGGELISHTPYKVTQDNAVYMHWTAIADGSGDIETFKTQDAAMWWLVMDAMV